MLNEAYDRMNKDVNASHILIAFDQKSTEKDKQVAYAKALDLRKNIVDGIVSFSDAAIAISLKILFEVQSPPPRTFPALADAISKSVSSFLKKECL